MPWTPSIFKISATGLGNNRPTEIFHFLYFSILTIVAKETGHNLNILNDASLASLGFLTWKVLGCIICKKTIAGLVLQCKVGPKINVLHYYSEREPCH